LKNNTVGGAGGQGREELVGSGPGPGGLASDVVLVVGKVGIVVEELDPRGGSATDWDWDWEWDWGVAGILKGEGETSVPGLIWALKGEGETRVPGLIVLMVLGVLAVIVFKGVR